MPWLFFWALWCLALTCGLGFDICKKRSRLSFSHGGAGSPLVFSLSHILYYVTYWWSFLASTPRVTLSTFGMRYAPFGADRAKQMFAVSSFFILSLKKTKKRKKCAKIARQASPSLVRGRGVFCFFVAKRVFFFLLRCFYFLSRHKKRKNDKPVATFSTRKKE